MIGIIIILFSMWWLGVLAGWNLHKLWLRSEYARLEFKPRVFQCAHTGEHHFEFFARYWIFNGEGPRRVCKRAYDEVPS